MKKKIAAIRERTGPANEVDASGDARIEHLDDTTAGGAAPGVKWVGVTVGREDTPTFMSMGR